MSGLFLAFAVMTALAVAAVLWPAFRDQRLARRESFELGVYRDQLAEIERDLERGLIAPAEARAARTEIERRLLRVANAAEGRGSEAPAPARRAVLLAAAVLLPLLAAGLYYRLGAPNLPDQPLAARQDRQPAPGQPDIAAMVARLEARLREAPEDVEGWLMLGRSKAVLGDAPASVAAYRRAQALAGDDPQVLAGLEIGRAHV